MSPDRTQFAAQFMAEAARQAFAHYAHCALIVAFLLVIAAGRRLNVGWFRR